MRKRRNGSLWSDMSVVTQTKKKDWGKQLQPRVGGLGQTDRSDEDSFGYFAYIHWLIRVCSGRFVFSRPSSVFIFVVVCYSLLSLLPRRGPLFFRVWNLIPLNISSFKFLSTLTPPFLLNAQAILFHP